MCYGDERKWNPTISDCKNCPPIAKIREVCDNVGNKKAMTIRMT